MSEIPAFHPENESKLTDEEIIKFRNQIIWPVIHRLWGHTFPKRMSPGESLEQTKTIISPNEVKLCLALYCFVDEDDDIGPSGDEVKRFLVRVGTEEAQAIDLKRAVVKLIEQADAEGETLDDPTDDDISDVDVWESKMFIFEFPAEGLISVNINYSLKDEEGYLVWDDSEFGEEDDEEPEVTWQEVEDLYDSTMIDQIATLQDIDHIIGVLAELGTPKRMLRWPR